MPESREPPQAPSFKADLTPPSQMSQARQNHPPSLGSYPDPDPSPHRPCPGNVDHSTDTPILTPPPVFKLLTSP